MSAAQSHSSSAPAGALAVIAETVTRQQQAQLAKPVVEFAERKARIQQVIDLLVAGHVSLADAMEADFGGRHRGFSLMNDILGALASLKHTRDNLGTWMEAESRPVFSPYDQLGATAKVQYQPKGVIGIMGTWNAPVYTLLSPLACVLGAGNRAVLKPSEVTPATARVLAELFAKFVDPELVAVINGDAEVGAAFASAGFDHLVFTGSTAVGKKVMTAAAANLTPVTLELGGKSPAIISRSGDLVEYCRRIAIAKGTNGGQICVSPDVLYVPAESLDVATETLLSQFKTLYPTITGNADLTPVINQTHFDRIQSYIEDARAKGAGIKVSHEGVEGDDRRLPLTLIVEPDADCTVMQQEIFGPVLIIKGYDKTSEVLADINSRENPLALYWFGTDQQEKELVLTHTRSGGVTVNDALAHAAMHDAPFGGTGASGIGHYHGKEGFLEFSHMKTILQAPDYDPRGEWGMLPPYHEGFEAMMAAQVTAD
ncbi:coniferyl aldehyde dehydrogenase [Shewanella submarina]|uniref:Aldehyde dehydrogenase n=1 Tax=Shewanella submarina TaxID=2016376 RepID=A0ABV7GJ76_9GAMM|nr:coniferyl aldehyde dehydrogenase [Shewanella submarina]MCL1037926.1 coniferyl aldehyde dehydrogenase [Shewanella submarina]